MHEHGLTDALVKKALELAAAQGVARLSRLRVSVGPFAGVKAAQVAAAFEHLKHHHGHEHPALSGAALVIEEPAPHSRCPACGHQSGEDAMGQTCPACGKAALELPEELTGVYLLEVG